MLYYRGPGSGGDVTALVPSSVESPARTTRAAGHLLVCIGPNVGHRYVIDRGEFIIGTASDCALVLDDRRAAPHHFRLISRGDVHQLEDLGSASGTLVNAERVHTVDLRDGDLIQSGMTVLRYWTGVPERSGDRNEGFERVGGGGPEALGDVRPRSGPARRKAAAAVEEESELSLQDIIDRVRVVIAFLLPYWRWIVGLSLAGLALGISTFFWAPPARQAIFEVSLMASVADNPLTPFERANVAFFRSAEQNFRSPALITKTLQDLGIENPSTGQVSSVQRRLNFGNVDPRYPGTYAGSFKDEDPNSAVKFLEAHVKLYLDTEIEKTLKVIRSEADFLRGQMESTEAELKRTEEELLAFKKGNIDGLPEQARQNYDLLFDLQRRRSETEALIERTTAELAASERSLSQEPAMVETRTMSTQPYQQAIVEVNRELANAKANGLGDNHPDVVAMRSKLAALKKMAVDKDSIGDAEVERSTNPVWRGVRDQVNRLSAAKNAAKNELVRLDSEIARLRGVVDRLPQLEAGFSELTRSYDATKALHTRIFEQLKATELQLQLERASAAARYDIITPPSLEPISTKKKLAERGIFGGAAGFLCGLAVACAFRVREILKNR